MPTRRTVITCVAAAFLASCGGSSSKSSTGAAASSSTTSTSTAAANTTQPAAAAAASAASSSAGAANGSVPQVTIPGQIAGAGPIQSVVFTGPSTDPTVTVNGTGLGQQPATNPTFTPEGHPLCPLPPSGDQGFDYGTKFYLFDSARDWAGGRFRPELNELDCIGLLASSFTPTKVVFKFGSAYTQYGQSKNFVLAEGDPYQLVVNGAAFQGTVHYTG